MWWKNDTMSTNDRLYQPLHINLPTSSNLSTFNILVVFDSRFHLQIPKILNNETKKKNSSTQTPPHFDGFDSEKTTKVRRFYVCVLGKLWKLGHHNKTLLAPPTGSMVKLLSWFVGVGGKESRAFLYGRRGGHVSLRQSMRKYMKGRTLLGSGACTKSNRNCDNHAIARFSLASVGTLYKDATKTRNTLVNIWHQHEYRI